MLQVLSPTLQRPCDDHTCTFNEVHKTIRHQLQPQFESNEVKEVAVEDIRFMEGTVHQDAVSGLVYETTRIVEEHYPRRGTFVVAYRRWVYANGLVVRKI